MVSEVLLREKSWDYEYVVYLDSFQDDDFAESEFFKDIRSYIVIKLVDEKCGYRIDEVFSVKSQSPEQALRECTKMIA